MYRYVAVGIIIRHEVYSTRARARVSHSARARGRRHAASLPSPLAASSENRGKRAPSTRRSRQISKHTKSEYIFVSLFRSFWSTRSRSEVLGTPIYARAVFTSPTRNIARTHKCSLFFGYGYYLALRFILNH